MRWFRSILIAVALLAGSAGNDLVCAVTDPHHAEEEINIGDMLFGHIGDSYGWHITEWNGRHVTIPLPCIVRSSTGWHLFMSSEIEHGRMYNGLFIAEEGRYEDKIVEVGPEGELVRPFDISITRNVASLMFSALLLICLVLGTAGWYRKHDAVTEGAPGGFAGLMEMMINTVFFWHISRVILKNTLTQGPI